MPKLANSGNINSLTTLRLIDKIHSRQLSCYEVMHAFLDIIGTHNKTYNALVNCIPAQESLKQAKLLDQNPNLFKGGLLRGIPQAPKDLFPLKGFKTTMGSVVFENKQTNQDAVIFSRIRRQGAIFIGRSNSPEFGLGCHTYNSVFGTTHNAIRPELSAGGSSGGAAVAVALGMLPVADGTDMMGSLRTPAAFNGIYGFRPTPGLIPSGAQNKMVKPPLSVAGPIARNVPDLALMFAIMADFPQSLPFKPLPTESNFVDPLKADLKNKRIAWMGTLNEHLQIEPGISDQCIQALEVLKQSGCVIEEHVPEFDYHSLWSSWTTLRSFLFYKAYFEVLGHRENFSLIKPEAQWEFKRGANISNTQLKSALQIHSKWVCTLNKTFKNFNYLALPATQVYPFAASQHWPKHIGVTPMDTYHRWMEIVVPASMAGLPTICLPVGNTNLGKGTGLQIMGPSNSDLAVLQLGYTYNQKTGDYKQ